MSLLLFELGSRRVEASAILRVAETLPFGGDVVAQAAESGERLALLEPLLQVLAKLLGFGREAPEPLLLGRVLAAEGRERFDPVEPGQVALADLLDARRRRGRRGRRGQRNHAHPHGCGAAGGQERVPRPVPAGPELSRACRARVSAA